METEINKTEISLMTHKKVHEIGIRIRERRKELHYSQQDLAFYCCADKCLISEIERGSSSNITLFTLFKISYVLEISIDVLFCG